MMNNSQIKSYFDDFKDKKTGKYKVDSILAALFGEESERIYDETPDTDSVVMQINSAINGENMLDWLVKAVIALTTFTLAKTDDSGNAIDVLEDELKQRLGVRHADTNFGGDGIAAVYPALYLFSTGYVHEQGTMTWPTGFDFSTYAPAVLLYLPERYAGATLLGPKTQILVSFRPYVRVWIRTGGATPNVAHYGAWETVTTDAHMFDVIAQQIAPVEEDVETMKDLVYTFFQGGNVLWKFCLRPMENTGGLEFRTTDRNTIHIDGDKADSNALNVAMYDGGLPAWMVPGTTYHATEQLVHGTNTGITVNYDFYDGATLLNTVTVSGDTVVAVPTNADGLRVRINVNVAQGTHVHYEVLYGLYPDAHFAGDVYAGGKKLATEEYVDEKNTEIAEETKEQVDKYAPTVQEAVENSRNLLRIYGTFSSGANNGVQFDWDGDKYILYGTSATGSIRAIVNSPATLPTWIVPGSILRVVIDAAYSGTASSSNIRLRFRFYTDATNYVQRNVSVSQDIDIPAGVTGIVLHLYVDGGTNCGTELNPTTYTISGYASKSNAALNDMIADAIGRINNAEDAISGFNSLIPTVDDLITSNSMDLMRLYQNYYSADTSGMHFVWDEATNSFRIHGRPTGTCYKTMMLYSDALPAGFTPGKSYTVMVKSDLSDGTYYGSNIRGRVTYYEEGTAGEPIQLTSSADGSERTITIPDTCTGIKFDIRVDGAISEITEANPVIFSLRIYDPANVAKKLSRLSDGAVVYRKTLTSSDDLDEIKQSGIFYYATGSRPAHCPTVHNSYLIVFANISQTSCIQFVVNNNSGVNAFYYRVCFSGQFSQWYTLAKTKDIPDSSGTTPDTIYIDSNGNGGSAIVFDEDGRDIPQNYGVINAYKRAHQMTDIVYTTRARTPSVNSNTGVPAATYRGIPYSSVKEIETYVPTDVSFETFMTAVHNPYSLLYTEAVAKEAGVRESLSKYGFSYNGTNGTCGLYYGAVCTQFAWYALGVEERWITANFNYLTTTGTLMKVYDNSGTGVRLMDLILEFTAAGKPHHARLVTDIYRNKRGVPERIFVSEAIAASAFVTDDDGNQFRTRGCRTTEYTLAEFNRVCIGEQRGQIFRYLQLYKNLDYEASDFVAVEDETPVAYSYNDDICTFAGNKAAFRKGFPVFINYEQGEFTNLVIAKDGTEIASIDITGGYEEGDRADTHSIEVTAHCNAAGKYTAHLANGSAASAPTLWEVLDTTTSIAGTLSNITVSFVKESNPMYIEFISETGGQVSLYKLSQQEKTKRSATFDAVAYSEQTTGANLTETHFVRVKYHGDYGNVISEKIALSTL